MVSSQPEDSLFIKKISDEIFLHGEAYNWLQQLTKKIGNRLTASPAFYKASDWAKQTLQQAGADEVKLQQCTVPHWVRGKKETVEIISVNNKKQQQKLSCIALGNSLGGSVSATVIAVENFEELEKRKDEVKGKIVFLNHPFNQTYIETFLAYRDVGRYRYSGATNAAKYGAVGYLVRSLSGSTDNMPHTGAMRYNDSFPKIPAAALGLHDANKLWNLCKSETVKISINTHANFLADTIAHNIIGELKGSEKPDEIITIGGHLDSWDVGEGAHDDGAGCVHTLEVLRTFKALGYAPKHTIRFVLFANEENGLKGGAKYAEEAAVKHEKHLIAIESDAGGFTPRGFSFTASNNQLNKIKSWAQLLLPYGTYKLEMGGGGPDIGALNEKLNIPVAELLPDSQRYFDLHHTNNDVFENVNKRELLLGAINIAALIYLVDKYGL